MDPITIGAIVLAVLLGAVLLGTQSGRDALKGLIGIGGARAKQGVDKLQTADDLMTNIKSEANAEATARMRGLAEAAKHAEGLLNDRKNMEAQLAEHQANLNRADSIVDKLESDQIPDEQQIEQLGKAKAAAQASLLEVNRLAAALKQNAPLYAEASKAVNEARGMMNSVPTEVRQLIQQGEYEVAMVKLNQSKAAMDQARTAFLGTSRATQNLDRLKSMSSEADAEAKAAHHAAMAAPRNASDVSNMLDQISAGESATSAYDEYRAARKAEQNSSAPATEKPSAA